MPNGFDTSWTGSRRFTLVELLVAIAIIAILASLLLPSLGEARFRANRVADLSNMRQITVGHLLYAGDSDGWLPPGETGPSEGPINTHVILRDWSSYEYRDYRPLARDYNFMPATANPVTGAPAWDDPSNDAAAVPHPLGPILRHTRTYRANRNYNSATAAQRRYVSPGRIAKADSDHIMSCNWLLWSAPSGLYYGTYVTNRNGHYQPYPNANGSFLTFTGVGCKGVHAATYDGAVTWRHAGELEFRLHPTGNHIYFAPNP
jgi:prepilin-type N-terminal cleavage/methylation domain-containing protein